MHTASGLDTKVSIMGVSSGQKNKSLVMPISDPRDRSFYPHHTPMKDTYNLIKVRTKSRASSALIVKERQVVT